MTLEEQLNHLPETANELASDVIADEHLLTRIRMRAAAPLQKHRVTWRVAVPAVAAAAVLLVLLTVPQRDFSVMPHIENLSAGNAGTIPQPSTRADLPAGSVTLESSGNVPAFRNIWAGNSEASFPMVLDNGKYYRLLSTPRNLNEKQLGNAIGTVTMLTSEMNGQGLCSNTVLQGENVWQVRGMGDAVVAARIDGSLRVFQRVTAGNAGQIPARLSEFMTASNVAELSLSGVGRIQNAQKAQELLSLLLNSASYVSGSCARSGQVLHIVYQNGITLQLYVSGNTCSSCGTWSCPAFFDQFQQSL